MGISDDEWKSSALEDISIELAKQGKVEEALTCAMGIRDERRKSSALKDISTELAKQGKVEEALTCAKGVSDESEKSSALLAISIELAKQAKVDEALTCARGISYDNIKWISLQGISTEFAKQDNWAIAEIVCLEIQQYKEMYNCWINIAKNTSQEKGWLNALKIILQLQNVELKAFYLKGVADSLTPNESFKEQILPALILYEADVLSITKILQQHSLNELFYTDFPANKAVSQYRHLNMQWAIDIKSKLFNVN